MVSVFMYVCFFVSSTTLVKAKVPSSLTVLDGASVYLSDDERESGIRFDLEIAKLDYKALVENNPKCEIYLGVQLIRTTNDKVLGEYNIDVAGTLKTSNTNSNNFAFNFSILFNEDSYVENLVQSGKIDASDEVAKANAIDKMYNDELAVKPFYKVVPADGASTVEYGEIGDSRAMIHVANAKLVLGDEQMPETFESTYINQRIENAGDVTVDYVSGEIFGANQEIIAFTANTSAEVIARENNVVSSVFLQNLNLNDSFALYGFTANRKVYEYNATYAYNATSLAEEVLISRDTGKVFLNGTPIENQTITDVIYNGNSIYANGAVDVTKLANVALAEKFETSILIDGGLYKVENTLLYDKVWENTVESRRDLTQFFSGADLRIGYGRGALGDKTLTGKYALAENIEFMNELGDMPSDLMLLETFTSSTSIANTKVTFAGEFNGRGFAMKNVATHYDGGIFGIIASNATIKNLAIIDAVIADYSNDKFTTSGSSGAGNILFNKASGANLTNITISDVYVEYTDVKDDTDFCVVKDIPSLIGNTNNNQVSINNFIIVKKYLDENGNAFTTKATEGVFADGNTNALTKGESVSIENTYVITWGRYANYVYDQFYEGFTKYQDYTAFEGAGIELNSFENNANWMIINGAPVWKSVQ